MKRLKLVSVLSLCLTVFAVAIATINLSKLYKNEKESTLKTVSKCAENAIILEMISRMEKGEKASQSYLGLNSFIEFAQQKDGHVAQADSLRTSLASVLLIGLEFKARKARINQNVVDSIFKEELARHDMFPSVATILPTDADLPDKDHLWTVQYSYSPRNKHDFDIYISPMTGEVLSRMWGIIIPFVLVILLFVFLSAYLGRTIRNLRTLEQMKDDFTHNMTHELKTPVAVAYSAADSMLRYYDQSDEKRNKQFLKIIMQRLSFLSGLIENILSMSMERFKTIELNKESVVVRSIAEDVTGMIKLKAKKAIEFDVEIPDDMTVMADPLHLGNVLSNLIDNSVKYSGDSVKINIIGKDNLLIISDNGIGIGSEHLPYIFDKFYRVPSGDRYEAGGYGLGLFYVKQIVELHGWSISVTSKPGTGTGFTIRF